MLTYATELSPNGLLQLMPLLGDDAIPIIADEIKYLSGQSHHYVRPTRYRGTRSSRFDYCTLSKDVLRLGNIPGAIAEAARLVCSLFESHLCKTETTLFNPNYDKISYVCWIFDNLLADTIRIMKISSKQWYDGWNPQQVLNTVQRLRTHNTRRVSRIVMSERVKQRKPCGVGISLENSPIFTRSIQSLQRPFIRHSREVGIILATKTAGHHLPPELVEMISDYFWDKDLLKALEADLARRIREAASASAVATQGTKQLVAASKDNVQAGEKLPIDLTKGYMN